MSELENVDVVQQKVAERRSQNTDERLIEVLVGDKIGSSHLVNRLETDKEVVRLKYDLPPEEMLRQNPGEYYGRLLTMAEQNGLAIRPREWDKEFFDNNDVTAKFEMDTGTIVFDLNDENERKLRISLKAFEHELVHGLQVAKYPNMPIEVMEYEAYVVSAPIELMKRSGKSMDLKVFVHEVAGSVMNWYKRQGEWPEWNDPEYFLKNIDHVESVNAEFVDLDAMDRSNFVWNRFTDKFDQMMMYVTGIDRNDEDQEKVKRRLMFDRAEVRSKYGLPVWAGDYDDGYISAIRARYETEGIVLGDENDFKEKFGKDLMSSGFCDDESLTVYVNSQKLASRDTRGEAKVLEHEFVHAMQVKTGRMLTKPPEQNEYEALVAANLNVWRMEEDMNSAIDYIAGGMIRSVESRYERKGLKAPWC